MGGSNDTGCDLTSTPRLSLYALPSKPPPTPGSLTPPLQTSATIPFLWEEVPGKPRSLINTSSDTTDTNLPPTNKIKAARCLELPPRLLLTSDQCSKVANVPSPTTTVSEGRSLSQTFSFSLGGSGGGEEEKEKVGSRSRGRNIFKSGKNVREKSFRFSSWRWGSFKDINRGASVGSFDFSSNSYVSNGGGGGGGGGGSGSERVSYSGFENDPKVKITRSVRRRSSFMSFSHSSLMASIYGSFKQAVPWRRKN